MSSTPNKSHGGSRAPEPASTPNTSTTTVGSNSVPAPAAPAPVPVAASAGRQKNREIWERVVKRRRIDVSSLDRGVSTEVVREFEGGEAQPTKDPSEWTTSILREHFAIARDPNLPVEKRRASYTIIQQLISKIDREHGNARSLEERIENLHSRAAIAQQMTKPVRPREPAEPEPHETRRTIQIDIPEQASDSGRGRPIMGTNEHSTGGTVRGSDQPSDMQKQKQASARPSHTSVDRGREAVPNVAAPPTPVPESNSATNGLPKLYQAPVSDPKRKPTASSTTQSRSDDAVTNANGTGGTLPALAETRSGLPNGTRETPMSHQNDIHSLSTNSHTGGHNGRAPAAATMVTTSEAQSQRRWGPPINNGSSSSASTQKTPGNASNPGFHQQQVERRPLGNSQTTQYPSAQPQAPSQTNGYHYASSRHPNNSVQAAPVSRAQAAPRPSAVNPPQSWDTTPSARPADQSSTRSTLAARQNSGSQQNEGPIDLSPKVSHSETEITLPPDMFTGSYSSFSGCLKPRPACRVKFHKHMTTVNITTDLARRLTAWDPYWFLRRSVQVGVTAPCKLVSRHNISGDPAENVPRTAATFSVTLTPQIIEKIPSHSWNTGNLSTAPSDGEFRLILRMFPLKPNMKKRGDNHLWPKGTYMTVDDEPIRLGALQRKQQSHEPTLWKGMCQTISLAPLMRCVQNKSFQFNLGFSDPSQYLFSVSLCEYKSPTRLFREMVAQGSELERTTLDESINEALESTREFDGGEGDGKFVFTLTCPISMTLMKTPVRGKRCKHWQCFDLENFIASNANVSGNRWRCTSCEIFFNIKELKLCALTESSLREFATKAEVSQRYRVEFHASTGKCYLLEKKPHSNESKRVKGSGSTDSSAPKETVQSNQKAQKHNNAMNAIEID